MEESLLNQCQIAGNQALKYQSLGSYNLAIQNHLLAAELLIKLQAKLPKENPVVHSLTYFINHHKRQAELDEVILALNKQKKTVPSVMNTKSLERSKTDLPVVPSPRRRIFEVPDSLLPTSCSTSGTKNPSYTVRPKSDSEIIEEYKMMIHNLKSVVAKQAEELMEAHKKSQRDDEMIRELKRRLESYESKAVITSNSSQYIPTVIPELPPLEPPPDCDFNI